MADRSANSWRRTNSWATHRYRRLRSLKRRLCGERLRGTLGAPINMADSFRPLRFKLFADSLKLVESCHLRRKLVVAKLRALCTDKYRNDKLMKSPPPTVAASGRESARDECKFPRRKQRERRCATARVQPENSSAATRSMQRAASQSFT